MATNVSKATRDVTVEMVGPAISTQRNGRHRDDARLEGTIGFSLRHARHSGIITDVISGTGDGK